MREVLNGATLRARRTHDETKMQGLFQKSLFDELVGLGDHVAVKALNFGFDALHKAIVE